MAKMLDQNIHLLLPKQELELLKRRARTERKSVAELIRQAIKLVYGMIEPQKKREAFLRISKHSELVMADWDQVKKDLHHRYE